MKIEIIYQDESILVVNKPSGVNVHKTENEPGLLDYLDGRGSLWLVHRLDKDTSGVLLLAKSAAVCAEYAKEFEQHRALKTYYALSDRKPKKKQGWIKGDMAKSRNGSWKLLHSQDDPAITQFSCKSIRPGLRSYTLLPKTGRTHQLRVAMKSIGAPILGDNRYGGTRSVRLMLHAAKLVIKDHVFNAEVPWELE